jgi:hypothetical protein
VAEVRERIRRAVVAVEAIFRADPDRARAVLEHGEAVVLAQAGGIEGIMAPAAQRAVRRHHEQAAARDDPQRAGVVERERLDPGRAGLVAQRHRRETARRRIAPRQAARRPHPQAPAPGQHAGDRVVRQAGGVARIVAQRLHPAAVHIDMQDAAAGRAQPQAAIGADGDPADLARAARVGGLARQQREARKAAAGEVRAADPTVHRAGPQRPGAVDPDRHDAVVGQRVAIERLAGVADEASGRGVAPFEAVEIRTDPQVVALVVVQRLHAPVVHAFVGAEVMALRDALADVPRFEAGVGADPQRVARSHRQCRHRVPLAVAGRVDVVMREADGARGQVVEADARADPQAATRIEGERRHAVVAQAGGILGVVTQRAPLARGRIDVHDPVARADPQAVRAVADDRGHGAVARIGLGAGQQRQADEPAGGGIEPYEPAARAEPQPVLAILVRGLDVVVDEARGIVGVVAEDLVAVAVEAVQARLRAEPHETVVVLQDREDGFLGQPLFQPDALEPQAARSARQRQRAHAGQQQATQHAQQRAVDDWAGFGFPGHGPNLPDRRKC